MIEVVLREGVLEVFEIMKGGKMFKKIVLLTLLLSFTLMIGIVCADDTTSGTLSAVLDEQNGTVTAMFVGYSEGNPVIIGPTTWESSSQDFSNATAEEIGSKLCGKEHNIKKVTRSTNTGKEVVAEVVISSQHAPILVGR